MSLPRAPTGKPVVGNICFQLQYLNLDGTVCTRPRDAPERADEAGNPIHDVWHDENAHFTGPFCMMPDAARVDEFIERAGQFADLVKGSRVSFDSLFMVDDHKRPGGKAWALAGTFFRPDRSDALEHMYAIHEYLTWRPGHDDSVPFGATDEAQYKWNIHRTAHDATGKPLPVVFDAAGNPTNRAEAEAYFKGLLGTTVQIKGSIIRTKNIESSKLVR